jgi:molybdopterin molybdotransferase
VTHQEPCGSHADPPLVPVEQHLTDVLAAIRPVEPVWVPLAGANGSVLAEHVTAGTPLPSFDNSAMDGYAVRAADLAGASADAPVTLPIHGEIAAGDTGDYQVRAGACLQIMTGARLPEGADAVVPVEWTDAGTTAVAIRRVPDLDHAVRHRGDDVAEGEVLLPQGTQIGPVQMALLAASGQGEVLARTPPRIAVISTGNELVEPGTPLIPGQIWESNSFMLAAACRRAGATVRRHRLRDDPAVVLTTLEGHAARDAAGLRGAGPGPDPDLHAARQPRQRVRVVRPVRAARARCPEKLFSATKTVRRGGPHPGRAFPEGPPVVLAGRAG